MNLNTNGSVAALVVSVGTTTVHLKGFRENFYALLELTKWNIDAACGYVDGLIYSILRNGI